jgi:hypothetical protein
MTRFYLTSLLKPGLFYLCYSYASCLSIVFGCLEIMLLLYLLCPLEYCYGNKTRLSNELEHGEPPRKTVQPQYYMALVLAN